MNLGDFERRLALDSLRTRVRATPLDIARDIDVRFEDAAMLLLDLQRAELARYDHDSRAWHAQ